MTGAVGVGHVRYTYRLRASSTARSALGREWDRCRWVWNECAAKSRAVHLRNKSRDGKSTCGPAELDRMLTEARACTPWLREGSSVPQQQVVRDFGRARAKAYKDVKERLPLPETGRVLGVDWGVRETATTTSDAYDPVHAGHGGRARAKAYKKVARQREDTGRKRAERVVRGHDAIAVEDFRPKFLAKTTMARKAADAAIGATKAALIEMGRKHGRDIRLDPAYTTMDCGRCDARAKHALPLGERTYTCTACGNVSPRDKNSARVMLVRAGLAPAGADGTRPPGALLQEAA
ncbi:RNA-guided endonuclease InsQ/TnpB family protein [Streptomyces anulatus]|uniref:RNA-guided endonuclease InsQ/TnpB family protein n=1 Tax=Streptomyces anulatus TaxID=1892 RepID=UPI003701B7C9